MKQSFYKIVATLSLLPLRRLGGFLLWMFPFWLSAQTSTQNYIVGTVPYQAIANPTTLTDANSNSTIQYFDGLGRPSQTVQQAISPTGADLVSGIKYDDFGRDYQHWLPGKVAGNSGAYVSDFGTPAVSTNGGDSKPYATTEYDGSPLNRVTGQYGAGVDWYNNTKKKVIAYTTNGADVKRFYVEGTQLKYTANYTTATLYGQKTTDEDVKTVEEFTDKQGRKILSRVAGDHDTYYVYDDQDNLRYVLPPMATDALGTNATGFDEAAGSTLYNYGYIYHYDGRKRCTEKKLPGCDWIYIVYDLADRLILSQDGNQRSKPTKQWTVTKYDQFGRMLYSGLINDGSSRSTMEANYSGSAINETYSGSGPVVGYTSGNLTPSTVLTVNYYDSYGFLSYSGNNPSGMLTNTTLSGYTNPDLSYTKTLLTGTRVYHLDNPSLFEATALYYDKYGRVVQTRATNHLGGYDLVYNELKFTGVPARTYKTHGINGASAAYTELYGYTYDNAQRLTNTTYSLNSGNPVTLAVNNYDELGRVSAKILGGIDATTYSYNVRSWTTGISGSRFSESLYYNANTANLPTFTSCYNGNIAGMQWNVPNESLGYNRAYTFAYDGLNRLTDANYCGFNGSVVGGTSGKYDEHFGFDKMGNFTALTRNENGSLLNNLSFTYIGNQMKKVDNSISPYIPYGSEAFNDKQRIDTEYSYDQNGSTTWDVNTGISLIQYNLLNLPDQIQFTEGHKNIYTYNAGGAKLRAVNYTVHNIVNVPINTISTLPANPSDYTKLTTDYVGNMIYENGALKEILLPEGYYQGGIYYYYLKDHLGNNRLVINSSGAVIEKSHYYPSGMRFFPESTSNSAALPYRYNGKELEAMNGLNQYDYGARRRGAGLPIFTTRDRFSEKYPWQSPYCHSGNNPINYIDVNGDSIWVNVYNSDTKSNDKYYYGTDKNGDQGFLDSSGKLYAGDNQYVSDLTDALSDLNSKSFGKSLVDNLARSTKSVTIADSRNGQNKADQNGTYILWSPKNKEGGMSENGKTSRPAFIGLGHEMGHIQDIWNGTINSSTWITVGGQDIQNSEKYATHVENQLRVEHSLPLRTHYAILEGVSGVNIGYEPTRIIISSNSLYYFKTNNLGYIKPFQYK